MSNLSSFIKFIHHLKISTDFCEDLKRSNPNSLAYKMFSDYTKRMNWILNDIITNPVFSNEVRNELRKEINSDLLVIPALIDKIHQIPIAQREIVENIVDCILNNETIEVAKS